MPIREIEAKEGDEVELADGYKLVVEEVSAGTVTVRIEEPGPERTDTDDNDNDGRIH